jgi:hypothetical protein
MQKKKLNVTKLCPYYSRAQNEADCDMLHGKNCKKLVKIHYGTLFKESMWLCPIVSMTANKIMNSKFTNMDGWLHM